MARNAAGTRMCVICREKKNKAELRKLEKESGGKSRYICEKQECLEKLKKREKKIAGK